MTQALITITPINDEPRVLDTDLAVALGMAKVENIRTDIIRANIGELEQLGIICRRQINTGKRGRPGTAYYLTEEQALLVCLLSRTEQAKAIRAEVIRVFTAWRRGELEARGAGPKLPDFSNPAEAARAWALEYERKQLLEQKNEELETKNAGMRAVFGAADQTITRFARTLDHRTAG